MKIFLISFFIFCLFLAAMAVGVIFGRRCLRGSCGGVGNCEACSDEKEERVNGKQVEQREPNPQISTVSVERN
jgi:hypothetical protein